MCRNWHAGGNNAGYLAVQMLALASPELASQAGGHRRKRCGVEALDPALNRSWLETVARHRLREGGVIVHATEGVFGLGCRAFDRDACRALAELKSRGPAKPFIVVAADFSQIAACINHAAVDLGRIFNGWPGPETWILPASSRAQPWLVSAERTIAVRVTGHPQFARLATACGPLISTSANPPGRPAALTLLRARHYFGHKIACYLPGELQRPGVPSRIRDGRSGGLLRG